MEFRNKIKIVTGVLILSVLMLYFSSATGFNGSLLSSVMFGLIVAFISFGAFKYFGIQSTQGKSILFLSSGILIWVAGDILWFFVTGGVGEISLADGIYLVGYLALIIGMIFGIYTLYNKITAYKMASFLAISLLIVFAYFNFFPLFWNNESSALENLVTSGYTIADFMLLLLSLCAMLLAISGIHSRAWIILSLGILSIFIGDIIYALYFEIYTGGGFFDVPYNLGYSLFAASIALLEHNARKVTSVLKDKKVPIKKTSKA